MFVYNDLLSVVFAIAISSVKDVTVIHVHVCMITGQILTGGFAK